MPKKSLLRMHYWDTYYYSQVVHNVLTDPVPYLRHLEDFFGDLNYTGFLTPYPRWTTLHRFIEQAFLSILEESIDDVMEDAIVNDEQYEPWVSQALVKHGIDHIRIRPWLAQRGIAVRDIDEDAIHEYHADLRDVGPLDRLLTQVAEEVFFLLFLNRNLLRRLHEEIAERVREVDPAVVPAEEALAFRKKGVLNREQPPSWARRAVFYRDRGMCVFCHCDLSGILATQNVECFDHIVPLAIGGTNEVTNLQLLCRECNAKKGAGRPESGTEYERWYATS